MLLSSLGPDAKDSPSWIKSSRSADSGCCVEVARHEDLVLIRDSKFRRTIHSTLDSEEVIAVSSADWCSFTATVHDEAPQNTGDLVVEMQLDGSMRLKSTMDDLVLEFTAQEWSAFADGVSMGEFSIDVLPVLT